MEAQPALTRVVIGGGRYTAQMTRRCQNRRLCARLERFASRERGTRSADHFGSAPAGTAREVIDRVAAASNEAAKSPDVVATLARQGFDMAGGSPEEFAVFIRDDLAKWERVAGAAGLKR